MSILVVALAAAMAGQEAAALTLSQQDICLDRHVDKPVDADKSSGADMNRYVDKHLLQGAVLAQAGIGTQAVIWASKLSENEREGLEPAAFLIARGSARCEEKHKGEPSERCAKLNAANQVMVTFLKDAQGEPPVKYKMEGVTGNPDMSKFAGKFFENKNYRIKCLDNSAAAEVPSDEQPQPETPFDLRIRGNASDLYAKREDASDAFSAADKASVSYNQDDIKHKRTRAVSGFVGLGYQISEKSLIGDENALGSFNVVPYVGISSNIAKAAGSNASVTSNTRQVGVEFYNYLYSPRVYYLSVRPQLSWDLTDRSHLFTTTFGYTPVVSDTINASRGFPGITGLTWQWILDGRMDHGHYTSPGTRAPEDARDFERAGGDIGFELDHTGSILPWSWKVTESYLHGWRDGLKNVSQLKSILSFNFGSQKLFGLDLTYTDGRDPDTAEKDKTWKISLGMKY